MITQDPIKISSVDLNPFLKMKTSEFIAMSYVKRKIIWQTLSQRDCNKM
jgi:hypothetical protein